MSTETADVARARAVVLRHGHNSTAYQTLNPGFQYYFPDHHDAVVAYVERAGTWVVAGAPVCAAADLPDVVAHFERAAESASREVCYACAAERLHALLANSPGHSVITLGAEPVWDPRGWEQLVARERSIRTQVNRARNKHVAVTERPPQDAREDVGLRRVLDDWVTSKALPPMEFLNSSDPAAGPLEDRRLFVASASDEPVAFLLASPIPGRDGYLVEQLARAPRSPNGTAELLLDATMRALAADGTERVTLGLVPLTRNAAGAARANPAWVRMLFAWARAHGRRFYAFDGLEAFREKLRPDRWDAMYAIANRPTFRPRMLYAMAAATLGGASPVPAMARAIGSAIRQEVAGWVSG
jgi:phosphatidylglycerol lysyltransferase